MALVDLNVPADSAPLSGDVQRFLRSARRRIERFQREVRAPGFVASDFPCVYAVLRALMEANAAPGNLFCEWGSGFGVVSGLAAMLGFEACGIEIEPELVDHARRLADDFALPVRFLHGSYLKGKDLDTLEPSGDFAWLGTDDSLPELEIEPADFDVVFVYPWPDEEQLVERLFARHAAAGAVMVSYHGDQIRIRRKKS